MEKKGYNTPKVELIKIDETDLILTSTNQQCHTCCCGSHHNKPKPKPKPHPCRPTNWWFCW